MNYIALDIGGTNISSAVVSGAGEIRTEIFSRPADSTAGRDEVIGKILASINEPLAAAQMRGDKIGGIGIGFPGPFDYENGISLMQGIGKYDSIYGVNIKEIIEKETGIKSLFINDADLYALGECAFGVGKGFRRVMCATIGTGLGGSFVADGKLVKSGDSVPENGWIFKTPCCGKIADDVVSAKGLRSEIKAAGLSNIDDVAMLASAAKSGNSTAINIFRRMGETLCQVVLPYAERFSADCVVLGGNVSRSAGLFCEPLKMELEKSGISLRVSEKFALNALSGCAVLFDN